MKRFRPGPFVMLVLGLVLASGLSLAPVHSGLMAIQMSAADTGMEEPDGCLDCDGDTGGPAMSADCAASCTAVSLAVFPASPAARPAERAGAPPAPDTTSPGLLPAPDPHPPRTGQPI